MGDTRLSARAGTAQSAEQFGSSIKDGESNRLNGDNQNQLVDALLVRIVEGEIIPRLMLAHKNEEPAPPRLAAQTRSPTPGEVEEFTRLALNQDQTVLDSYIQGMLESGCGMDDLMLDLLAPSARRLGEMWEEDECSFVEVTIGLSHLHNTLHHMSRKARGRQELKTPGKRGLLATVPGEQHIFGILMVESFLQRQGWDIEGGIMAQSEAELVDLVKSQWFAMVGLTLNGHRLVKETKSAISAIKKNSLNPEVKVIVGGHTFLADPELVDEVGADLFARDADEATKLADKCLLGAEVKE